MDTVTVLVNATGMALVIAFVAFAIATGLEILWSMAVSFWRDIVNGLCRLRTWWQIRRPARGWQPEDHPRPRIAKRWPR